jgi:hypothetical protein
LAKPLAKPRDNYYSCAKQVRAYSTSSSNGNDYSDDQFIPAVIYEDAFSMKKAILKDNDGKAGIYMFTNKVTADIYVGQSVDPLPPPLGGAPLSRGGGVKDFLTILI